VKAQNEYIFRGNYGLVSKEKMMETSLDAKIVHKFIRMQLKFAFVSIRDTEDPLAPRIRAVCPTAFTKFQSVLCVIFPSYAGNCWKPISTALAISAETYVPADLPKIFSYATCVTAPP
jgi:hemerythrin